MRMLCIGGLGAQNAPQTFPVRGSCVEYVRTYVRWERSPYGHCSKEDTAVAVHVTKGPIQLKQWHVESLYNLCVEPIVAA